MLPFLPVSKFVEIDINQIRGGGGGEGEGDEGT